MKISVIIPTFNGKHKLGNILSTLSSQSIKDFETIVVIDGSSDGTVHYLNENSFDLNLMVHPQENRGRAAVRNKGAYLATGDLLIFFDDDMRLEPVCIEAHIDHHQNNPDSILTGAQIDDPQKATTDFQHFKCLLSQQWVSNFTDQKTKLITKENVYLTAANFSISKKLFFELGGFDESLRDCEDYDLALKALARNIDIYYSEKAFGWHDDFPTPRSFIKRQLEYKEFNSRLFKKDPDLFSHLLNSRLKKPGKKERLFFSLFKSDFWIKAMEKNNFIFLPSSLRYRLYSWIITAHSNYKEHL